MAKTLSKKSSKKISFKPDYEVMKKAALTLRAINHKDRQKILELLDQKGELAVTDIYTRMHMEQSRVSAFLALMRKANLVIVRAEGQQRFYSVNYDQIELMESYSKKIAE